MEQAKQKSGTTQPGFLSTWFSLSLLLAAVLLAACQLPVRPVGGPIAEVVRQDPDAPWLSCFLNLQDSEGPAIRLEIAEIEVLANDVWLPISTGPLKVESEKIGAGQLFLGGRSVPIGDYHRLRLTVARGAVRRADGEFQVIVKEPLKMEIGLAAPLSLEAEDSRSLFVTWDVNSSLETDTVLRPALTVAGSAKPLLTDVVFVTCPDIDTVFVVRADKNWVVDSFGVKGGPTYLAVDPDPSRQRLYVLASRARIVKVVDLSSYRVVDFFPVSLNDAPTFMTLSPNGREAFLVDERSGYVSSIDLATGASGPRALLGHRPHYAVFLSSQNLLAVSLSLSQRVQLLSPSTLAVAATIPTGNAPQGLLVSDGQLYVANSGDDTVSIVDVAGRGNQDRMSVGFAPRRLIAVDNRIYVSNYDDGSLSVLVPGQLGVVQEIHGLGRPLEMAFDQSYRRLYVADEEAGALAVVDLNSNLLLGRIAFGAKPSGLAVIQ